MDQEIIKRFIGECDPFREIGQPINISHYNIESINLEHPDLIRIIFNEGTHISLSKKDYNKAVAKKRDAKINIILNND